MYDDSDGWRGQFRLDKESKIGDCHDDNRDRSQLDRAALLIDIAQRTGPCSFPSKSIIDPSIRLIANYVWERNRLFLSSLLLQMA